MKWPQPRNAGKIYNKVPVSGLECGFCLGWNLEFQPFQNYYNLIENVGVLFFHPQTVSHKMCSILWLGLETFSKCERRVRKCPYFLLKVLIYSNRGRINIKPFRPILRPTHVTLCKTQYEIVYFVWIKICWYFQ